ncbi:hypothetical protein [Quatrionicoccus australiensis]|uniref:hypothetical protein n=1 Tax=Quatrionicoccus australiensis TaxID=138118 RepID=UPI001CFA7521|nr:hypothetical protein [Quatrionicoccus australiensis]MCB4359588.1 hypothetical protein [Quatrionicoccus australiensis]
MPRTSKSTVQQLVEAEAQLEKCQLKVAALRRKRGQELAHEHAVKCRRLGEVVRSELTSDVTESQLRAALALVKAAQAAGSEVGSSVAPDVEHVAPSYSA